MQRTLEREIRGCQHLILWTDGDREGENIADEIVEVVTQGILHGYTYVPYW
jgi:DNA topoisomerase IA